MELKALGGSLDDLPAYNIARNTQQFYDVDYPYLNLAADGDPWLKLRLRSMTSLPKYLPAFLEGQPIRGQVVLDLKKAESNIKAVDVSVCPFAFLLTKFIDRFHSFIRSKDGPYSTRWIVSASYRSLKTCGVQPETPATATTVATVSSRRFSI